MLRRQCGIPLSRADLANRSAQFYTFIFYRNPFLPSLLGQPHAALIVPNPGLFEYRFRPVQNLQGYISRVTRLVTTSAAAHTRFRLNHALRRAARPSLL